MFAAHCNLEEPAAVHPSSQSRFDLVQCQTHPDAGLGNGKDIGFCRFAHGSPPVAFPVGLSSADISLNGSVHFAGFGAGTSVLASVPRVLVGRVVGLRREIEVEFSGEILHKGDSGGGVFTRSDSGWNLAAIASSASPARADGRRWRFVRIEELSQLDSAILDSAIPDSAIVATRATAAPFLGTLHSEAISPPLPNWARFVAWVGLGFLLSLCVVLLLAPLRRRAR